MNNQELVQEQYGTAPLRERVNEALDPAGLSSFGSAEVVLPDFATNRRACTMSDDASMGSREAEMFQLDPLDRQPRLDDRLSA
jgi:hypothetical protein